MKKVVLFVMALSLSATLFAGGGVFEAWMTYGINGEAVAAHQVNADEVNLGTVSNFQIDSFFVKVWQEGGENFDPVQVGYKLDNGDVQELQLEWKRDLSDKDREWAGELKKDLAADLADGNHSLEMWFHGTLHNGENSQEIYMNNEGKNYKFNFTKGEAPKEEISLQLKSQEWNKIAFAETDVQDSLVAKVSYTEAQTDELIILGDELYKVPAGGEHLNRDNSVYWWQLVKDAENTSNLFLDIDIAGEYTFIWKAASHELKVIFPTKPEPNVEWFVIGSFNNWEAGFKLEGEDAKALTAKVAVEANKLYEFKLLRVAGEENVWFGLPNEGNVMKYGECTDWIIYKTEGEINKANVGLQTTKAGEYTFTVDVTNTVKEDEHDVFAPKISVNIPEPEPSVTKWFVMGSFNNWEGGFELTGEAQPLTTTIAVDAKTYYEFKLIRVMDNDTAWFGLGTEGNVMQYGACTDWLAYETIADQNINAANIGLLTTQAGGYLFSVDVTNTVKDEAENDILAPKFSVAIPEPAPVVVEWFVMGSFNDWTQGYKLKGEADNALSVKIELEANAEHQFKLIRVEEKDTVWFGLAEEGHVMNAESCTDWIAYKSEGELNQANIGLKADAAGEYTFIVDVTNLDGEAVAPKFSVVFPEPQGIENVAFDLNLNAPMFDMTGRQVSEDYHGVVIQNGHKFIR